jgi:hypothetical protein
MLYALCFMLYAKCPPAHTHLRTPARARTLKYARPPAPDRPPACESPPAHESLPSKAHRRFVYNFYGFLDNFVYNFYGFLDNFLRLFLFCFLCSTNLVSAVQKSDYLF